MKIRENTPYRDKILAGLSQVMERSGHAHQHELYCTRRGVAERLMIIKGVDLAPPRRLALLFVRGNMREGPIAATLQAATGNPAVVYKDVIVRPDVYVNDPQFPFAEIKSTNMTSRNAWELLTTRGGEIVLGEYEGYMASYFWQCCNYCIALGSSQCLLVVYWEHGDYADRRKNCPERGCVKVELGPLVDGFYRDCPQCGYRAYTRDLRTYELEFTQQERDDREADVFDTRAPEFRAAVDKLTIKTSSADVLPMTTAYPQYQCRDCSGGDYVRCEHVGEKVG